MRWTAAVVVLLMAACTSPAPPSPSPALTPAPTARPAQTPTASGTLPPSSGLNIDARLIAEHLDALQAIADANNGIRTAGTPGYDASADYVEQAMTGLGFEVERQSFDFPFFDETQPVEVGFGDIGWSSPSWLHAALYSADGDAEAPMDIVGAGTLTNGCESSDWNGFDAGDVALVYSGGGCYTRDKIMLAQEAGAAAVISCYPTWQENQIRRPTLLDPAGITIPVVAAGSKPCAALANQEGNVVNVFVDGESRSATVDNVIATLPGATERVAMLGGHLDSVLDGPGINDNGSGVATILSLAASIAAQPEAQSTIRIGFWSAEEWGDLGSRAYVDSLDATQRGLIDAYLNLDMVGSPNPGRYVYDEPGPAGSADLTARLLAAFDTLGAPATTTNTGGASDHFWFAQTGIPIGGVFSGIAPMTAAEAELFGGNANELEDPCYHLACDTTQNIDLDNAVLLGRAVAIVLGELAYQH